MTSAVVVRGGEAYVIAGQHGDLDILNGLDLAARAESSHVNNAGESWTLVAYGDRVYQPSGNPGLQVIDVSNPAHPTASAPISISGYPRQVAVTNDAAYVIDSGGTLHIINMASSFPYEAATYQVRGARWTSRWPAPMPF